MSASSGHDRSLPADTLLLVESSHVLPLVDIEIAIPIGSLHDPPGKEGLAQLTAALIRRGPRGMSSKRFEETLACLGAHLSIEVSMRATRIEARVLSRHVYPLLELVSRCLWDPALREVDFNQVKRVFQTSMLEQLDDDQILGSLCLRKKLFEGHPYGRPTGGSTESLGRLTISNVREFYEQGLSRSLVIVGASGDVEQKALERWTIEHFPQRCNEKPRENLEVRAPRMERGRRVYIVDKPDRVQTQLFVATLGLRIRDPLLFPMFVSNTAFGGMFSGRLMQAVRAERGWSYEAYSSLQYSTQKDAWYMSTAPSAEYSADCVALQLDLMERWVCGGIRPSEVRLAKKHLIQSRCFDRDTAFKRLQSRISIDLFSVPPSYVYDYESRIGRVSTQDANRAVARRLSTDDLIIVVVATASQVASSFEEIPGIRSLDIIPFDSV